MTVLSNKAAAILLVFPAATLYAADVQVAYTGDYFHNTQGGIRTGDTYLDLLEVSLTQSLQVSDTWQMQLHASGIYTNGNLLSQNIVGDVQIASSLEGGGRFTKLATASVELSHARASYLVGLYDVNSEFDVLDSAALFINSGHGIGSDIALTGENGPSIYPFYSLAFRALWRLDEHHIVRAAVMDGVPGSLSSNNAPDPQWDSDQGYFSIAEYERSSKTSKLLIGGWQYSKSVEINAVSESESDRQSGNFGAYLRYETDLYSASTKGFYRVGYADADFNQFDWFFGAGITHQGAIASRPDDLVGLAIAYVHNSVSVLESQSQIEKLASHETSLEVTYQYQLNSSVFIQPNIQYVFNPAGRYSDALVAGVRFAFAYSD